MRFALPSVMTGIPSATLVVRTSAFNLVIIISFWVPRSVVGQSYASSLFKTALFVDFDFSAVKSLRKTCWNNMAAELASFAVFTTHLQGTVHCHDGQDWGALFLRKIAGIGHFNSTASNPARSRTVRNPQPT